MELQLDSMYDCDRIVQEVRARPSDGRPELVALLDALTPKDVLVAWKLGSLGRNLGQVVRRVDQLRDCEAHLVLLQERVDSRTDSGAAFLQATAMLAQLDRDWTRQRTEVGLKVAKARGKLGGRPRSVTADTIASACDLRRSGWSVKQICQALSLSKASYYRYCGPRGTA